MNIKSGKITSVNYKNELFKFHEIIVNYFPIYDLDIFIEKLYSLKIESKVTNLKDLLAKSNGGHSCVYYPEDNKIFLIKQDVKDYHIYHELFHLLSSYEENNIVYSGFSQCNNKEYTSIGNGINEGYTQFLKERYFGVDEKEINYYMLQKHIAKHLEIIVSQRKMESMYAEADLLGLISELKKYEDEEKIINFIYDVDYINENIKNKTEYNNINMILNKSLLFLINMYIKKQDLLLEKKLLNDNIYKKNIENFIESISYPLYYRGKNYKTISYDDIKNVLANFNLAPSEKTH